MNGMTTADYKVVVDTGVEELVCAAYAQGRNEAYVYCRVLEESGIVAVLGETATPTAEFHGGAPIPLLVSASCLERAAELLAEFEVVKSDLDDSDSDIDDDDDLGDDDDDDDDDFFDDDDDDDDFDDDDGDDFEDAGDDD